MTRTNTFPTHSYTDPKSIANAFNLQFNPPKPSNKTARKTTRHVHTHQLDNPPIYTPEDVQQAIAACKNSKAFGPDRLTIFHLKHLGPIALRALTYIYNRSLATATIPMIWKRSQIIPIPKPGKDHSLSGSFRPISLLSPAVKVLERLILPTINKHLPSPDYQHGFKPKHSTTSALLPLVTHIAENLNAKGRSKPTVAIALDLTKAFDTVDHNTLLSRIASSTLPSPFVRWLAAYLRGRQASTLFRDKESRIRLVKAGTPQGAVISPTLFNFYLSTLPPPPEGVYITMYADDITIYCSGRDLPSIEAKLNPYLVKVADHLRSLNLSISPSKSTSTYFTLNTHEFNATPQIFLDGNLLPCSKSPKILGVTFDNSLTFRQHAADMASRASRKNNIIKALAGTNWGQDKETLLLTYKALGRSILNYAAPVWSPNIANSNLAKMQTSQNEALRVAIGCYQGTPADHLHQETNILPLRNHVDLLSTQYLVAAQDPAHPCNNTIDRYAGPTIKRHTLASRYRPPIRRLQPKPDPSEIKPLMQQIHTKAVNTAIAGYKPNPILGHAPPPIDESEMTLPRTTRAMLAQLRCGRSRTLKSYMHTLDPTIPDTCPHCKSARHTTPHLFTCKRKQMDGRPLDLWHHPCNFPELSPS